MSIKKKIKYTEEFLEKIDVAITGLTLLGYCSIDDFRYVNTDNDTEFILNMFSDNIFLTTYHDNEYFSRTYYHGEENEVIEKLQSLT